MQSSGANQVEPAKGGILIGVVDGVAAPVRSILTFSIESELSERTFDRASLEVWEGS